MPIEYHDNTARFIEIVSVEDAEGLLEWLQGRKEPQVDLATCTHLHAANLQVLMAARPAVNAWPAEADLSAWLKAALEKA